MLEAANACGATVVQTVFHSFNPHGVSGVVVIAESHLAIHTWPEYGHAAVDVFTCGDSIDPNVALEYLRDGLGAREVTSQEVDRLRLPGGIAEGGNGKANATPRKQRELEPTPPD
jgi:S-adenosylmethionine decarboxylase